MLSTIGAWLTWLGIQPAHLIAGVAGGIIRALINKNGSIWERIIEGTVGTLLSAFLTPFVIMMFAVSAPQIGAAIAVILGMLGMSLAKALIEIGKDYARHPGKLKEDLRAFFLRVIDKDKNPP